MNRFSSQRQHRWKQRKPRSKQGTITRRGALSRALTLSVGAAAMRIPQARAETAIRWWSTQSSPEQLAAYRYQIATFEAQHPGVKVLFEKTSDEGYPAQLAAAFAGGDVPNLVTHLPSFAVADYWRAGLLAPFDPVIEQVGADRFFEGTNRVYEISPGAHAAAGIGNTAANMLWLRTDLMQQAGIDTAAPYLGRAASGLPPHAGPGDLWRPASLCPQHRHEPCHRGLYPPGRRPATVAGPGGRHRQ